MFVPYVKEKSYKFVQFNWRPTSTDYWMGLKKNIFNVKINTWHCTKSAVYIIHLGEKSIFIYYFNECNTWCLHKNNLTFKFTTSLCHYFIFFV